MAANKFATILHRNTNKFTLILVYAALEWILILLLLINSLFSHLTIKFAEFFGLKPPCPWCTRLDHIFGHERGSKTTHRDLICEFHAMEISKLGFCSIHRKLDESRGMCEDCLSSMPEFQGFSRNFALLRNDKELVGENGVVNSKCCCCGVSLDDDDDDDDALFNTYLLLRTSSLEISECAKKENFITEAGDICDSDYTELCVGDEIIPFKLDENVAEVKELEAAENEDEDEVSGVGVKLEGVEVLGVGVKLESVEDKVMLIMKDKSVQADGIDNDISTQDLEFWLDCSGNKLVPIESLDGTTGEKGHSEGDFCVIEDRSSSKGFEVQVEENGDLVSKNESKLEEVDLVIDVDVNGEPKFAMLESVEMEEGEDSLFFHAEDGHLVNKDAGVVQETNIASGEMNLDIGAACEEAVWVESNGADVSIETDIHGLDITDEVQNPGSSVCTRQGVVPVIDEDGMSELEVISDGVVTIEHLKSMLRDKQKALEALYAELEEERSASEEAANQTMAMINRLQEEKAAIQIEAIQYQRLMEEQSEYDQQALQILNDLVVEREKENQELENELELYKRVLKKNNLSIDINQERDNQNSGFGECFLADFEDERSSVLKQLRVLEEKLVTLDDENGFVKKSLFPLFDEIGDENGNGFDSNVMHNCSVSKLETRNKKLASEEEMNHLLK